MKAAQKEKIAAAFNAVDQLAGQLVLPVPQGGGLVQRLQALANEINAIEVDAEPQPVENLVPLPRKKGT